MRTKWCIVAIAFLFAYPVDAAAQQRVTWDRQSTPSAEATPGLRLMGIASGDDGSALAIVRLPDGRVEFLKVGGTVQDYAVTAIEARRVLLKNAQGELALDLVGGDPNGRIERAVTPDGRVMAAISADRSNFAEYVIAVWEAVGGGEIRHSGDQLVFMGPEAPNGSARPVAMVRLPPELGGDASEGYGASVAAPASTER